MSSSGGLATAPAPRATPGEPSRHAHADVAWLALVPCAAIVALAVLLLGPPLGRLLFPAHDPHATFWPALLRSGQVLPEPTEHARYLLATAGALLLPAVVALVMRRAHARTPGPLRHVAVQASQAALVAFLAACVIAQRQISYGAVYGLAPPRHRAYLTPATLVASVAIGIVLLLALRRAEGTLRLTAPRSERRVMRVVVLVLAGLFTATWLLAAVNTESTIGNANLGVQINMPTWLDETFAVLNGRAPLVGFFPQYGNVWPYATGGLMALLGRSVGVFATIMLLTSGVSLLGIYALLRRVTRSSWAALALYVPFVSTGFFTIAGPLANRYSPVNLFSDAPIRYAGPYLLAWLMARRLDGVRPRAFWPVLAVAGLVAINNADFGIPALAATLAAEGWARGRLTAREAIRIGRDLALGLAVALALMCALTLLAAGSLPRFSALLRSIKLYGVDGFGLMPMPALGLHLAIFATFAAALVVATARAVRRDPGSLLTGMLAWAGTFGLGAGAYFVGRSHPDVLIVLFSAWALALSLLVVALASAPGRWPALPSLALLAGFGVLLCSVAQTPTPWSQVARLRHASAPSPMRQLAEERFVAAVTRPAEPILILDPLGHRTAYDTGRRNVSPYTSARHMPTTQRLDEAVRQLREAGGHRVFLRLTTTLPEVVAALRRDGFRSVRVGPERIVELADGGPDLAR